MPQYQPVLRPFCLAIIQISWQEFWKGVILRNINNITANLDRATQQLNSTNSSLGLLLNDPELYNNLNNCAAHVDSILIDLKKKPKHYIPSIKIF